MAEERSIDRLARYIIFFAAAALIIAFCWYFRSTLVYILLAAVVALIARPIKRILGKIKIKGKGIPDGVLSILTLILITCAFIGIFTQIIPVIYSIVENISTNMQVANSSSSGLSEFIDKINIWLITTFPTLEPDFSIQTWAVDFIRKTFDISSVTSVVGSVASIIGNVGIAIFSVLFIGFFFIRDEKLFSKIIAAIVPVKYEKRSVQAISSIEHLLSRYFVGLIIEVLGVATLNFLGLLTFAKLGLSTSLGIAFMTGILNVIPYLGPWIGAAIGTLLGVVLKYSSAAATGGNLTLVVVIVTLIAVFLFTQLVDNFVFQPLIYSTSIKSTPLEIFIVILMAGHIGGVVGMLVAIPAYTVMRVIAMEFFYNVKAVRMLIPQREDSIQELAEEPDELAPDPVKKKAEK